MITVSIDQFKGYDIDEFTLFLKESDDNVFEIIVPNETTLFYTSNEEIAWEFAIAAYIGEKLSEISSEFSYSSASLAEPSQFTFNIKTTNIDDLADLLLKVSSVFGNSDMVEPIDFNSEVSSFLKDFRQKEVICQDLFDTAWEYHSE